MFVIRQKRGRPFTWFITDHASIKGQTLRMELEYEVIDRLFHCTVRKRGNPRDHFGKGRPATPEEMEIAKSAIGEKEFARCIAESINPSIWARASDAAKKRRTVQLIGANFSIMDPDGIVRPIENVSLPRLP